MKSFKIFTLLAIALRVIFSCAQKPLQTSSQSTEKINIENISTKLPWSERMMRSEMKRFPEAWQLDFFKTPKWSYPNGLVLKCAELLFKKTGKKEYYDYIKGYTDELVNEDGTIKTYDIKKYNLDMLNSGNVLLYLYSVDKQEKYLKAIQLLRSQIDNQPRTSEGGFWHKKIYPNQMWLDGLYMAEPFYANYTKLFSTGAEAAKAYDDIANQFDVIQKHMVDSRTG
ncbi:MAG: glycosyl hydrolase family 88, partial [Chryseobacterium sp.]|nr:glycosyl hydrolase family 88 [Chryseobacterium sp.]